MCWTLYNNLQNNNQVRPLYTFCTILQKQNKVQQSAKILNCVSRQVPIWIVLLFWTAFKLHWNKQTKLSFFFFFYPSEGVPPKVFSVWYDQNKLWMHWVCLEHLKVSSVPFVIHCLVLPSKLQFHWHQYK